MAVTRTEVLGALLMAFAACANAGSLAILKVANAGHDKIPGMQLALIRVAVQMLGVVWPTMLRSRIPPLPADAKHTWPFIFGRAISGGCAMLLSVLTALLLPLG